MNAPCKTTNHCRNEYITTTPDCALLDLRAWRYKVSV